VRAPPGRRHRDAIAAFPERVTIEVDGLGEVLFCHGSPRSDEEILTTLTPQAALAEALAGVEAAIVVCGHTHAQFDRRHGSVLILNAGSVGMPYEGRRRAAESCRRVKRPSQNLAAAEAGRSSPATGLRRAERSAGASRKGDRSVRSRVPR
jgi:diadenosine tetraphosphatase ApaH/serine/threonine PP2A family protein phosphatase